MSTKVVHCKEDSYDVYVGRPSKWGNPFRIGPDGSREEVLEKFRTWIMEQPQLLEDIDELKGKTISCWCKPEACHADILAYLADNYHDS